MQLHKVKNMRKPTVENKYNLTPAKIRKLRIADRSLIHEPLFWRNSGIQAWCICESAGTAADEQFGTNTSYWIGIYDENAKAYAGKFRFYFTSYGGMCGYSFKQFFQEKDIECENDLLIQERFLQKINQLIDLGILSME
jgi:hypothetical protein